MKIAIITSGFLPVVDGVTVSGFYRLRKLSQWGHQVLLFCPDYSSLEKVYPNWRDYSGDILPGVRVINLSSTTFMGLDFERNVSRSSYPTLLRELENFQPDIIHVDEPERLSVGFLRVAGVDFAQKHGIPCVSFFRTNFLDYLEDYFPLPAAAMAVIKFLFKKFLCWVYNSYDLTLVSSSITHIKLIEMGIENTFHSDLLGIDLIKFNSNYYEKGFFKNKYRIPNLDRKVKLVFLGRLTPDKGWKFTLNAFSKVAQIVKMKEVALLVAGDGPMQEEIAKGLGKFTSNVHFLGRIPPDDVPALLANSDIHVTTSEKETRGLTILEAFAAGIPVIAPRAGGVTENIKGGRNGFLFTPQEPDDFAQKLKILIENPTLRKEMGAQGRKDVTKYSWDKTVRNLVEIWEKQIHQAMKKSEVMPHK